MNDKLSIPFKRKTIKNRMVRLKDITSHVLLNKIILRARYFFRRHRAIVLSIIMVENILRNSHLIN